MSSLSPYLKRQNLKEIAVGHPPQHPVDPDTTRILDSIVQTAKEVDALRTDKAALEIQLEEARREVAYYKEQTEKERIEKNFYMRHTTVLTTRLNDIGALIIRSVDEAKRAAYAPTMHEQAAAPEQEQQPEDQIDEGMQKIAAKFGANNRQG